MDEDVEKTSAVVELRDYLAAHALVGLLSGMRKPDLDAVAMEAYAYADAMLDAREVGADDEEPAGHSPGD